MPDKVKYIAHRGYSGAECENTLQAFKLACESGFYGAECDVHVTSDGKYVVFHDDETGRMLNSDGAHNTKYPTCGNI